MVFIERYRTINHPDANIIFVGHSKGGAEAAANAVATGKKAILFNPAKANYAAYGLTIDDYNSEDMIRYVVDGEVLNKALSIIPDPVGITETIDKKNILQKTSDAFMSGPAITTYQKIYKLVNIINSVYRHTMTKVIKELTEEESKK